MKKMVALLLCVCLTLAASQFALADDDTKSIFETTVTLCESYAASPSNAQFELVVDCFLMAYSLKIKEHISSTASWYINSQDSDTLFSIDIQTLTRILENVEKYENGEMEQSWIVDDIKMLSQAYIAVN